MKRKKAEYEICGVKYTSVKGKGGVREKFRSIMNKYGTHRPDRNGNVVWEESDFVFFLDMICVGHPIADHKLNPIPFGVLQRKKKQTKYPAPQYEMYFQDENDIPQDNAVGMTTLFNNFGKTEKKLKQYKVKDGFEKACRYAVKSDTNQFRADEFAKNPNQTYRGTVLKNNSVTEVDHVGKHEFRHILDKFKDDLNKTGQSWEDCDIVDIDDTENGEREFVDPDIAARFRSLHRKLAKYKLIDGPSHRHKPVK